MLLSRVTRRCMDYALRFSEGLTHVSLSVAAAVTAAEVASSVSAMRDEEAQREDTSLTEADEDDGLLVTRILKQAEYDDGTLDMHTTRFRLAALTKVAHTPINAGLLSIVLRKESLCHHEREPKACKNQKEVASLTASGSNDDGFLVTRTLQYAAIGDH